MTVRRKKKKSEYCTVVKCARCDKRITGGKDPSKMPFKMGKYMGKVRPLCETC